MKSNYLKIIGSAAIAVVFIVLGFGSDSNSKSSSTSSTSNTNCINTAAYNSGYNDGHLNASMISNGLKGTSDCQTYVNSYNEELGRDVLTASDCYCQGFDDGYAGRPNNNSGQSNNTNSEQSNNNNGQSNKNDEQGNNTNSEQGNSNTVQSTNTNSEQSNNNTRNDNQNSATKNIPIPTNGLIAWYPFNGNANDASGNENNGMIFGATLTNDRFGNANCAYSFDGNSVIKVQNSQSLDGIKNSYSISVWTKINFFNNIGQFPIIDKNNACPPSSGNTPFLFVADEQNTSGYSIQSINCGVAQVIARAGSPAITHSWMNTVCIYDGNNISIYVNGILKSTTPFTGNLANGNGSLTIGHANFGAGNSWANGMIDDIRIYNRALDLSEITALYNEGGATNNVNQ